MKRLTAQESRHYLIACGVTENKLQIVCNENLTVELPDSIAKQHAIIKELMSAFEQASECCVWFRECNVDSMDYGIVRVLSWVTDSLPDKPGFLLNHNEFEAAIGAVRIAAAFQWSIVCCSSVCTKFVSITDIYASVGNAQVPRSPEQ